MGQTKIKEEYLAKLENSRTGLCFQIKAEYMRMYVKELGGDNLFVMQTQNIM